MAVKFTKMQKYRGSEYSSIYRKTFRGIAYPFITAGREVDIDTYAELNNDIRYGYRASNNGIGNISSVNTYNSTRLYIKEDGSSTVRGYPLMVTANTQDATDSNGLLLETVSISGRFRFGTNISWAGYWNYLWDGTINVNVSINGNNQRAVIFCTNKNWSRSYGSVSAQPSILYIQTYNEYGNDYNAPPDLFGGYSIDGVTLAPEYVNMIWDFGNVPQEVPKQFKDWVLANADEIFPYTFEVKSQNGVNVLASITEAPAMTTAEVVSVGKQKTLTLTGVNGQTYTMTWESETPDGKQFLGLAYGANETRASIPTGRTTPVTWDGSLTIYEAYGTYRPPVTTFDINLYQSSAEVNRVDKTNFLTGVGTLSGVLREECSIIAPSITFKQTTVPTFNYVYIAAFGRYYYVTGITSVSKDIWRMSLSCDVLMTWKDDIRALTAIIARQENSFNPLLLDSELPAQANQNITVTEFPAGGFSTDSAIAYPFILTVVGA